LQSLGFVMSIFEDTSALVALASALVSGAAALYARWQAHAAKRANEIALHESRLRVYNGLTRFRGHLKAHGLSLKEEDVWNFSDLVDACEFYFPANVAACVNSIDAKAMLLLHKNQAWCETREAELEKAQRLEKDRHELWITLIDDCTAAKAQLRPFLYIGEA